MCELRGEAEVGVDLVVDFPRCGGLEGYADVVDQDGDVFVFYEGGEGG